MLLVMLFNFLVGLTDIYVAGFLGPEIHAIVGFVSQLHFFIIIVANAISIGTVALVSRAVGAGKFGDALSAAKQSLLFGTVCALALTNGLRIEAIIYLPAFALSMAASVLTGQNLGAGASERAQKIGWKIAVSGVLFVSIMALPIFICTGDITSPVAKDWQVLAETTRYLRITMLSEPFMALSVILGECIQGARDTKGAMLVIVSALWIIRLPLAYLLAVFAGFGALGVWLAMVISMCVQGIAMTIRFRNGRWKEVRPWG